MKLYKAYYAEWLVFEKKKTLTLVLIILIAVSIKLMKNEMLTNGGYYIDESIEQKTASLIRNECILKKTRRKGNKETNKTIQIKTTSELML